MQVPVSTESVAWQPLHYYHQSFCIYWKKNVRQGTNYSYIVPNESFKLVKFYWSTLPFEPWWFDYPFQLEQKYFFFKKVGHCPFSKNRAISACMPKSSSSDKTSPKPRSRMKISSSQSQLRISSALVLIMCFRIEASMFLLSAKYMVLILRQSIQW